MSIKNRRYKPFHAYLLTLIVLALFFVRPYLFPSEKDKLRKLLNEIHNQAEITDSRNPLNLLQKTERLSQFFTPSIEIFYLNDDTNKALVRGMESLHQGVMLASSQLKNFRGDFRDLNIEIEGDSATAEFTGHGQGSLKNGSEFSESADIKVLFIKADGRWKVQQVTGTVLTE